MQLSNPLLHGGHGVFEISLHFLHLLLDKLLFVEEFGLHLRHLGLLRHQFVILGLDGLLQGSNLFFELGNLCDMIRVVTPISTPVFAELGHLGQGLVRVAGGQLDLGHIWSLGYLVIEVLVLGRG